MIGRRRSDPAPALLVVGLGNPGDRYDHTRHNVGADAVRRLVERHGERLRADRRTSAAVADLRIGGARVSCAVPTTFMNESGRSVSSLVRRAGLEDWSTLVVVHDELDLEPGRVKLKSGGGLAGHNGLKSITQHLRTQDYTRVRIGVGKPPGGAGRGADWVLSKVPAAQRGPLVESQERAADAVELVLDRGLDAAMAEVNRG